MARGMFLKFESQALIGAIACISVLILLVNIVCKTVIYRMKKHFAKLEAEI